MADRLLYPGPQDPSVLTLQHNHRSELVWDDADVPVLDIRKCDHYLWDGYPFDQRVEALLREVGFHGVYVASKIKLDWHLITALIERWRQETHTFHLPVGEVTVTLQDIAVIWGLPIQGFPVIADEGVRSIMDWQDMALELLGYAPDPDDFDGDRLAVKSIAGHLRLHPVTPNSTVQEVEQHTRCRLMLFSSFICSDKSGTKCKLMYLPLFGNLQEVANYSWGSAVLASLYRGMCRAVTKGTSSVCGPVVLLQLWAWERIPKLRPTLLNEYIANNARNIADGPRGCKWIHPLSFPNVSTHVLRIYRSQLDYLLEGDFIWQPYCESELLELPSYCLSGREIWNAQVPLINFDIVEFHAPDRVMRQFGLQQPVPQDIDTNSKLHRTDRRGRSGEKWATKHSNFIEWWTDAENCICKGYDADNTPLPYQSPYMQWYFSITRLLVGNPSHRLDQGMQPFGALVEYWSQCFTQLHGSLDEVIANLHINEYPIESKLLTVRDMCARALDVAGETRRLQTAADRATTSRHTEGQPSFSRSAQGGASMSPHDQGATSTSAPHQAGEDYGSNQQDSYFAGYTLQQGGDLSHFQASLTHPVHNDGYTHTDADLLGGQLQHHGETTPREQTFQGFGRQSISHSVPSLPRFYRRRKKPASNVDDPHISSPASTEDGPHISSPIDTLIDQEPTRKQPIRPTNRPRCGTGGCL